MYDLLCIRIIIRILAIYAVVCILFILASTPRTGLVSILEYSRVASAKSNNR